MKYLFQFLENHRLKITAVREIRRRRFREYLKPLELGKIELQAVFRIPGEMSRKRTEFMIPFSVQTSLGWVIFFYTVLEFYQFYHFTVKLKVIFHYLSNNELPLRLRGERTLQIPTHHSKLFTQASLRLWNVLLDMKASQTPLSR